MPERGFTYLGLMFIVAIAAMTASMASAVWSTAHRRDQERELVFAGQQIATAIESYRKRSTDERRLYPRSLAELLSDERQSARQHHLRRIYIDPITGDARWGLVRLPDGGIVGVHSNSARAPLDRVFVTPGFVPPPKSKTYQDWRFVAPSAATLWVPPSDNDVLSSSQ